MKDYSKYKYLIRRSFYVCCSFLIFLIALGGSENVDPTGLGKILVYFVVGIFIILELVCLKKTFDSKTEGTNYSFNLIISFIFLAFSILCIFLGICLRTTEENMAKEYYNETKTPETVQELVEFIKKNKTDAIDKLLPERTENEERLLEIYGEMQDQPNTFYRYFTIFTKGFLVRYYGANREKIWFYYTYTVVALISFIQFVWYSSNSVRDKRFDIMDK